MNSGDRCQASAVIDLPVDPEARAESIRGNRRAPQAELDAFGKSDLAVGFSV